MLSRTGVGAGACAACPFWAARLGLGANAGAAQAACLPLYMLPGRKAAAATGEGAAAGIAKCSVVMGLTSFMALAPFGAPAGRRNAAAAPPRPGAGANAGAPAEALPLMPVQCQKCAEQTFGVVKRTPIEQCWRCSRGGRNHM